MEENKKNNTEETVDKVKEAASEKIEQMKNISADDVKKKAEEAKDMAKEKIDKLQNMSPDNKKKYGLVAAVVLLVFIFIGGGDAESNIREAIELSIDANLEARPGMSNKKYERMRCRSARNVLGDSAGVASYSITSSKRCDQALEGAEEKQEMIDEMENEDRAEIVQLEMDAAITLIDEFCEEEKEFREWFKDLETDLKDEYCPKR